MVEAKKEPGLRKKAEKKEEKKTENAKKEVKPEIPIQKIHLTPNISLIKRVLFFLIPFIVFYAIVIAYLYFF